MPDNAAFLKGINLGKRRLSNAELQGHLDALGLSGAAIFRASGNVVFSDPASRPDSALAELIERGLEERLGYPVATFVRSRAEVLQIAAATPLDPATTSRLGGKLQVALLSKKPAPGARSEALALAGEDDALAFGRRELFWLPAGGMSDSKLDLKALERLLGPMTIRTSGTIEQIAAKHFGA